MINFFKTIVLVLMVMMSENVFASMMVLNENGVINESGIINESYSFEITDPGIYEATLYGEESDFLSIGLTIFQDNMLIKYPLIGMNIPLYFVADIGMYDVNVIGVMGCNQDSGNFQVDIRNTIPIPQSLLLFTSGILVLITLRRKKLS